MTYSGSTAAPIVTNPGPVVMVEVGTRYGPFSSPFYVPGGSGPTRSRVGSSGVKVPGEPGLAGSEALPEGQGPKVPDAAGSGEGAYREANTAQQEANTRLPVEELTDCPGCQARISYWRNREDEEAKEREVAEAIAKQGLGCGELPPPPAWRGLRQEVEASRLAWEVAWEAAESPPSGGDDPGEDDAQTYFDLGALQKRGEVVEVSPATGCASCGEDHVPADDPYAGEACKVDGKRYHRRPVGLGVERGEAATVRGVDGKRYPWKEWEAAGRPPGEKPHPSGCCCDVCHREPKHFLRPHPPFYHIAGGGCPCGEV